MRQWRLKNKEKTNATRKLYREKKRKEALSRGEVWREEPKEKIDARRTEWRIKNKKHVMGYSRTYMQIRRKENPQIRISESLRGRLRACIKNKKQSVSLKEIVGCNYLYLKNHIESKFVDNMSWDNYGVRGWHIDHIKPCSLFDLNDIEQQKQCFNYKNLQPMWARDNIIKSNKHGKYKQT